MAIITVDIQLDDEELARVDLEVQRLVQTTEPTLTRQRFVARMMRKLVRNWIAQDKAAIADANRVVLRETIAGLESDPDRDTKLAVLGLVADETGALTKFEPPE